MEGIIKAPAPAVVSPATNVGPAIMDKAWLTQQSRVLFSGANLQKMKENSRYKDYTDPEEYNI